MRGHGQGHGQGAPRRRHGFFLQLALILITLFGIYVITYFAFMRSQTEISSRLLSGEIAHHVAQAGISLGISYFHNTKQPSELFKVALARDAQAVNGMKEDVPVEDNPALQSILDDAGERASLKVELELDNFRPFYAQSTSPVGIEYGQIEKHGTLRVTSRATVGASKRTVVVLKDVKVIASVPYVLGKFTMFVKERLANQRLNGIAYDKVDLASGQAKEGGTLKPLFFNHGPSTNVEEKGWVFLGGGVYELNLTWGGNSWGEQFLVLEKPWRITYDPNLAVGLPPGYELLTLQRGFFDGIKGDNNLFDNFDFSSPADNPIGNATNLIHLYGAPDSNAVAPGIGPSPTIVLGRVYRRYLDLKYLRDLNTQKVAFLPYASVNDWSAAPPMPWPAEPPFDVRTTVAQGEYPNYYPLMSKVRRESYNRGYDFVLSNGDLSPAKNLVDPQRVKHLGNNPEFLYVGRENDGSVILSGADGVKLFEGRLDNITTRHQFLAERAVFTMPAARFSEFAASTRKDVPGILHFKDGDVSIDRPLELDSGGIIVVSGNITIASGVKVKPFGRPLTLASLGGSITISTDSRIEACLMALDGTINKDPGVPLNISGGLVAKNLDFTDLCLSDQPGAVFYDPRLDSTAGAANRYSVHISDVREYFMGE